MDSIKRKQDSVGSPRGAADSPLAQAPRCRRCRKLIVDPETETYFLRTGLCFWCAYVDAQG